MRAPSPMVSISARHCLSVTATSMIAFAIPRGGNRYRKCHRSSSRRDCGARRVSSCSSLARMPTLATGRHRDIGQAQGNMLAATGEAAFPFGGQNAHGDGLAADHIPERHGVVHRAGNTRRPGQHGDAAGCIDCYSRSLFAPSGLPSRVTEDDILAPLLSASLGEGAP